MIQKGEPVSYLSFLIMIIVFGSLVFLATQTTGASVTGAGVADVSSGYCGSGGFCYIVTAMVFCAIFIAALVFTRRHA